MWRRRWGIAVTILALCMHLLVSTRDPWARGAQGDGYYAWLFARSLVHDHDIEFTNDYQVCGDRWKVGVDRGTGHPNNNFSFGQIVFWVPALYVARAVVPIPKDAPPEVRASCIGPRVSFVLFLSPILGALALWLCYLIARRWATDGAAALAAALVGLCGTNLAYAGFMVSYSHIYAAFAVALLFWTTLRAEEEDTWKWWSWVAFAVALVAFQRPTTAAFGLVPLVVALRKFVNKAWTRPRLAGVLGLLIGGLALGVLPTLLVYRYLFGSPWIVPQGRYYIFLGHAHPWLVLFAPRGGLFYSAPTAWFGVFGLVLAIGTRRLRPLFVAMLAGAAIETYLAASALDWHESWGFGARRLTTLTPMLIAAGALFFERAREWFAHRPDRTRAALGVAMVVPALFFTFGLVDGSAHNAMDPGQSHPQAEFYGAGSRWTWGLFDEHVGDLAILPAELAFSLRYGLPPMSFRDATEPFAYAREQRGEMRFTSDRFPLADARMARISSGFSQVDGKLVLHQRRGRIVFAAEWPYANAYRITARSPNEVTVRIGSGHAFGRVHWFGDGETLAPNAGKTSTFAIPSGEFDSGINELVVEQSGDTPLEISAIQIVDDVKRPPAMGPIAR